MKRKQKRIVRILAIVLAALLALGAVVSAVLSMASAEEMPKADRETMTIEYYENEQALRITQRLVYTNTSGHALDRVIFRVPANILRRSELLYYDEEQLNSAFPFGYIPGGIDLINVNVNDAQASYGFRNKETELRVSCDLESGAAGTFEFEYWVLLPKNHAFLGIGETGWRLRDFYFAPESYDAYTQEFIYNAPTAFTRTIDTPRADWDIQITLPDSCVLTGTGEKTVSAGENRMNVWNVHARGVHDVALCFGAKYRKTEDETDSGVKIIACMDRSGKGKDAVRAAKTAIEACEAMFGKFPFAQFEIAEADIAEGHVSMSGCVWLNADTMNSDRMTHAVRFAVAQQYFGFAAYARVSSDAWLSDSISEYIAYLITDRLNGHDAYLKELNAGVLDSLRYTIPGGFKITSPASLMNRHEYEAIILDRGAAVFHEMSIDMGTEGLIAGLRAFYEMGRVKPVLTEMDLVEAFDRATGGSWEKSLTDWVLNIGDYVEQSPDWLD